MPNDKALADIRVTRCWHVKRRSLGLEVILSRPVVPGDRSILEIRALVNRRTDPVTFTVTVPPRSGKLHVRARCARCA